MATRTPEIHDHLPRCLTLTRDGQPRKPLPAVAALKPEELGRIRAVRDRLLALYFPSGCREPYARVPYGYLDQDYGKTLSRVAGDEVCSYPVPRKDGTTSRRSDRADYLYVPDEWEGKARWRGSLQMWMRHLSGGDAIFPIWTEEDERTCILVDLDVEDDRGRDVNAMLPQVTAPWRDALAEVESEIGVNLHAEWMVSGSKGFWLQIFLRRPVSKLAAAEFVLGLAARVAAHHRVETKVHILNLTSDRKGWETAIAGRQGGDLKWIVDSGSLRNAPCRLPFATHAQTARSAVFIEDGVVIADQVSHLLAVERTDADIASIAAHLRPLGVAPHPTPRWDNESHRLPVATGEEDDLWDWDTPGIVATTEEGDDKGPASDFADEPSTPPAGSNVEGEEGAGEVTVDKMSHPCSGWLADSGMGGQRVTPIGAILGTEVAPIPLDSLIPPLSDGDTNDLLTTEGHVLDRVYGWLRAHRGEFTADDVTDALMEHYVGTEPGKRAEIRRVVACGMRRGRHLRQNPDHWPHPCVAVCRGIADHHGLDQSSRVFKVLVYLAYKGWRRDGFATATALEIAKSLGLSTAEVKVDNASQLAIGRDLKRLAEMGVIRQTVKGTPGNYSVYLVHGVAERLAAGCTEGTAPPATGIPGSETA